MKNRGEFIFNLVLAAAVLGFIVTAFSFPREVRALPIIVGTATLVLLATLIAGEFLPAIVRWTETTLDDVWGGGGGKIKAVVAPVEDTPWRSVMRIVSWAVGFLLFVFLAGFFLASPIFVAAFLIVEARVRTGNAILASLAANLGLFAGMAGLKVELWVGAIPEVIEGYLGGAVLPPL